MVSGECGLMAAMPKQAEVDIPLVITNTFAVFVLALQVVLK